MQYEWKYNGHTIIPFEMPEDDNLKIGYDVVCPDGNLRSPDVSPYSATEELINRWIDLGYPERIGVGPLDDGDLDFIEANQLPS
jgi:hypothetical protein